MDLVTALLSIILFYCHSCKGTRLQSGQIICKDGTKKPCYKVIYFHDTSRRLTFAEAQEECRRDGGYLMVIKTAAEQRLIQQLIQSLTASDGDFWLGLRRDENDFPNSSDCQSLYTWVDGSKPTFWNWYADEPSCGSEVCVVMYYQPLASPGIGGPYMFQWNDDRCNMRNNFICKYSEDKKSHHPTKIPSLSFTEAGTLTTKEPEISIKNTNETAKEADESYVHFILIATIPVLTLFFIFIGVVCCCIIERRKQMRNETAVKEPSFWMSHHRRNSPNLEIYNVIKRQTEAELAETRPNIRNTSFRVPSGETSPPDNLSGDYDNLGSMERNHSESGFVTLASTESGFVTNELYELCTDRYGRSTESGWVENEIYGY